MERAEFEALVTRLTTEAERYPTLYRTKVLLLTLFGYGTLMVAAVAALVCSVGLAILMFAKPILLKFIKFAWIPLVFAWVVLKSMFVRVAPPDGRRLQREEAPDLFREIDAVRDALAVPPLKAVIVDPEVNAGVVQVPRFLGMLGTDRYLILGLPLMAGLDRDAFRAVLAHEFGHLSGNHARFGAWVYRIRMSWQRIAEAADSGGRLEGWLARFVHWYVPYYLAFTYVLARQNEYEADLAAAGVTSPQAAAAALVGVSVISEQVGEHHWPGVFRRIDAESEPPVGAITALRSVASGVDSGDAARYVERALQRQTTVDDTHPSTRDRLAALGVTPPDWVPPTEPASRLLGASEAALFAEHDLKWRQDVEPSWRARHAEMEQERVELAALEGRDPTTLTAGERFRHAQLIEEHRGPEPAQPLYAATVADHPGCAPAHFALGRLLLTREDAAGLEHLRRACELDVEAIEPASRLGYAWAQDRGRSEDAADFERRFDADQDERQRAAQERGDVTEHDELEPHGLEPQAVNMFILEVARLGWVADIYLARKRVHLRPDWPCYILGFTTRTFSFAPEEKVHKVLAALPDGFAVVVLDLEQLKWARKKLKAVPDALVKG